MKPLSFSRLPREFVEFRVRTDRPTFISRRFQTYLTGTVLDVGCDEAVLRNLVGPKNYAGVGMTEHSDVKVDLEKEGRLPFQDATWETVLCLDVLEHLNNFHDFSDELFRVAKRYVIISLPNCWSQARRSLASGKGAIWQYGLPLTKPQDRHKWFFNSEEAWTFLVKQAELRGIQILEMIALENRRPSINRFWRHLKYPSARQYLNLYPSTIVCVYGLRTEDRNALDQD